MSSFKKCDNSVRKLAAEILTQYDCYQPLLDARVTVDYLFAFGPRDGEGMLSGPALTKNGVRVLGLASKQPAKLRALGVMDCLVQLDGDWWEAAETKDDQRKALLDHELFHFMVVLDDKGPKLDCCKRPQVELRDHDAEVGWFFCVAERHGEASQERIQAKAILAAAPQLFLPGILFPVDDPNDMRVTVSSGDKSVDTTVGQMKQLSKKLKDA